MLRHGESFKKNSNKLIWGGGIILLMHTPATEKKLWFPCNQRQKKHFLLFQVSGVRGLKKSIGSLGLQSWETHQSPMGVPLMLPAWELSDSPSHVKDV